MCCHPQAGDYRSTPKHGYLEYEIMIPYHDIHSLTYRNNPHNSQKSSIFKSEVGQKCHKSLQNSGKYSTSVEFHAFEIHILMTI